MTIPNIPFGGPDGSEREPDSGTPYFKPVVAAELQDPITGQPISIGPSGTISVQITLPTPTPTGTSVASYDAGILYNSQWGITGTYVSAPSGVLTNVTDSPPTGSRIVITDIICLAGSSATFFILQEETTSFPIMAWVNLANTTFVFYPKGKLKTPTPGKRLQIKPNQVGCNVLISYYYEP